MESLDSSEELQLLESSDEASMSSGVLFSGEDSRSSDDMSTTSGESSGDIPDAVVAIGRVHLSKGISGESPARERCMGRPERVSWGYTAVIGRRAEMEDAVVVFPGFISHTCCHVGGCTASGSRRFVQISPLHFFGVYDGHGGSQVTGFCAKRMHEIIAEEWSRERINGYEWQKKWKEAFVSGFKRPDEQVITEAIASVMVGSTAVVAVLSGC